MKTCDLVMKGGIASGIVYPEAVVELSREFAFQGIGGTSAGAIAAAATATADEVRAKAKGWSRTMPWPGLLRELGRRMQPGNILLADQAALARLEGEFEPSISSRFKYAWFAEDDESKENGEVIPGVGGSVYELLGIGDSKTKNSFVPELVRERRKLLHR